MGYKENIVNIYFILSLYNFVKYYLFDKNELNLFPCFFFLSLSIFQASVLLPLRTSVFSKGTSIIYQPSNSGAPMTSTGDTGHAPGAVPLN